MSAPSNLILAYVPEFPDQLGYHDALELAKKREAEAVEALHQDALKLSSVASAAAESAEDRRAAGLAREAQLLKELGY